MQGVYMKHYYVLFSGGLDSSFAVIKILKQKKDIIITPLFFKYGQKAARKEEESIDKLIPLLRKLGGKNNNVVGNCRKYDIGCGDLFKWSESSILKGNKDFGDPDLENRNMILISIAISIIMSDRKKESSCKTKRGLIVGFRNEHYDTKRKFVMELNEVIKQKDFQIEIVTPLVDNNQPRYQRSLANEIHSMKGIQDILHNTWSCYYPTPEGSPCGKCMPCEFRNNLRSTLIKQVRKEVNYTIRGR